LLVNTEIQIMKIYDMIEGKWLKNEKKEEKEKKTKDYKDLDIRIRLITYDEEREWLEREKTNKSRRSDRDDDPDNSGPAQR